MKYIQKALFNETYGVPINCHVVESYTVVPKHNVVVANVISFYDDTNLGDDNKQPLQMSSVVLLNPPADGILDWAYQALTTHGEEWDNSVYIPTTYGIVQRNFLRGGAVIDKGAVAEPDTEPSEEMEDLDLPDTDLENE